jgi:hypothetical protein
MKKWSKRMIKLFWLVLSLGCIGWYLTVLGYVAIRGGADIKNMLKKLAGSTPDSQVETQE